ncbi:MAG: NTPase [Candidatus Bathyarchaeia archaeon]
MTKKIVITGPPGVGKTTVLLKTIQILRTRGLQVGGMICREVRVDGVRIGFKVEDLESGRWGWLAKADFKTGIKVGRYGVKIEDLEEIGVAALRRALVSESIPVVALDEIGPMELKSRRFREAVVDIIRSPKLVIAVLHHKISDPLVELLNSKNPIIFQVSFTNRDELPNNIATVIVDTLKSAKLI